MKRNEAGQHIGFEMLSKAESTMGDSVTTGTPVVYVTGDGGTQAVGTGTSSHKGNGDWDYTPTQAETNYSHVRFLMTITDAFSQLVNVYPTYPQTGDAFDLVGDLENVSITDINATVDTALVDYGANTVTPPTTTEIVSAIDSTSSQLSDLTTRLSALRAGFLDKLNVVGSLANSDDAGTYKSDVSALSTSAEISALDTLIDAIKSVTDKMDDTLQDDGGTYQFTENALELAPSSTGGDATLANQTDIISQLSEVKGSGFVEADDSLEAIRDRGDVAWLTGAGGSSPTVEDIRTEMDTNSTKLTSILADVTGLDGEAMRGTDNANTTTPPTTGQIVDAIDTSSTQLALLATRLSAARALFLDKLDVTGTIADSSTASLYKAEVTALVNILEDTSTTLPALIDNLPGAAEISDDLLSSALADLNANDLDIGKVITVAKALRGSVNRFYRDVLQTSSQQTVKNDSGVVVSTMALAEIAGTSQTKGAAV